MGGRRAPGPSEEGLGSASLERSPAGERRGREGVPGASPRGACGGGAHNPGLTFLLQEPATALPLP